MKIIVCIKSVVTAAQEDRVNRAPGLMELNPFDRPALEAALRLKDERGAEVIALSMGPAAAGPGLLDAVGLGADRAVLLSDRAFAGADTLATSTVLAAGLSRLAPFDLVVFGTRTADSDTGQVGPQVAARLGLPFIGSVVKLETIGGKIFAERRVDGFIENYEAAFPAAISIHAGFGVCRDLGLYGLADAWAGERVETLGLTDLGLDPATVGEAGSPTRVLSMKKVPRDHRCEFIKGSAAEQAEELTRRLIEKGLLRS